MRIRLTSGAYTARSVISAAQRCVNMYPEVNPGGATVATRVDSGAPMCLYNAPGLAPLGAPPNAPGRALYAANNGTLYYLAGNTLYSVSQAWVLTPLGTVFTSSGIASMADNGTTLVLVDGSPNGYQVNLSTNSMSHISAATNAPPPAGGAVYDFHGADRVDAVDGYIVFNQPNTSNFYSTYNNEIVFDSLFFAAKNGYSDNLVTIIVTKLEIWLIGQRTTEIWYNAGLADFPFSRMPGPFSQHGCSAKYSVAQVDGAIFFLSQDQAGNNVLTRGFGYQIARISTHALEQEWATYSTTSDAQGFCFQFGGHSFYQINFPTANKSWRWDDITHLWHEPVYTDSNGAENKHRASCAAFAYGANVMADWETGQLYSCSPDVYTDNGSPMYFRRGFPHMVQDGRRVIYPGFTLDVEAATSYLQTSTPPIPDSAPPIDTSPQVLLRWSDDRGKTWGQPVAQSLGATGNTLTQPQWSRLGMARDRVFEVFGAIPGRLAIQGAWLDPNPIKLMS
jgi:hypothetical protein